MTISELNEIFATKEFDETASARAGLDRFNNLTGIRGMLDDLSRTQGKSYFADVAGAAAGLDHFHNSTGIRGMLDDLSRMQGNSYFADIAGTASGLDHFHNLTGIRGMLDDLSRMPGTSNFADVARAAAGLDHFNNLAGVRGMLNELSRMPAKSYFADVAGVASGLDHFHNLTGIRGMLANLSRMPGTSNFADVAGSAAGLDHFNNLTGIRGLIEDLSSMLGRDSNDAAAEIPRLRFDYPSLGYESKSWLANAVAPSSVLDRVSTPLPNKELSGRKTLLEFLLIEKLDDGRLVQIQHIRMKHIPPVGTRLTLKSADGEVHFIVGNIHTVVDVDEGTCSEPIQLSVHRSLRADTYYEAAYRLDDLIGPDAGLFPFPNEDGDE